MNSFSTPMSKNFIRFGQMRGLIRKATHPGEFLRSVRTLMTGTVFSQILLIAASPILTRLYSPEDFGKLAVFLAVAGMIGIFATMRYHYALVIAETDAEVAAVFDLCIRIATVIVFTSFLTLVIVQTTYTALGVETKLGWLSLLIPVLIATNALSSVLSGLCNRQSEYGTLSKGAMAQSVSSTSFNLVAGSISPNAFSLVSGQLAGSIANCFAMGWGMSRRDQLQSRASWLRLFWASERKDLIGVAKKYVKFPKFDIWTDLANIGSIQLPILLIATMFAEAFAGFMVLSQRVVGLPMTFIGSAIGQVFYRRVSELKNSPTEVAELVKRVYRAVFFIGLGPTLVLLGWGDILFGWAFGREWQNAGILAQFLAPAFLFQFVASPLSSIFWVDQKQEKTMRFCIVLLSARTLSIAIPAVLGLDFFFSAGLYGLIGCILWLGFCLQILKQCKVSIYPILIETALAIFMGGGIVLFSRWAAVMYWGIQ